MPISQAEAYLYAAYNAKRETSADVAIGINALGTLLGTAKQTARHANDYRTAIVNLLQNGVAQRFWSIISTCAPKEIDVGMAKMQGVSRIVFIHNQMLSYVNPKNNNPLAGIMAYPGRGDVNLVREDAVFTGSDRERMTKSYQWMNRNRSQLASKGVGDARRVNAQHASGSVAVQRLTTPKAAIYPPGRSDNPLRHKIFVNLAYAILDVTERMRGSGLMEGGRPIGTVIVNAEDEIVGWGINSFDVNKTFHGETNAIMNFFRKRSRTNMNNHRLYTTLEPCYMCAGVIANSGTGIEVYYGADDPKITGSALDRGVGGNTQKEHFTFGGAKLRLQQQLLGIHGAYDRGAPQVRNVTSFLRTAQAGSVIKDYYQRYLDTKKELTTDADVTGWTQGFQLLIKVMETGGRDLV